jgi:hypothetical protein
MLVNGYTVYDRNNRPSVLQPVGLRCFFINNGVFQDPYEISSVTVFTLADNTSPSTILTSANLIDPTIASSVVKMGFKNAATLTTNATFDASNYTPGTTANGIYKLSTGEYVTVLNGQVALSGSYEGTTIANKASSVGDYIDIWTVRWVQNSDWEIFINDFRLYRDTIFTSTEPLLISTTNRLTNKHVKLGSKVDLKVVTEINIGNKNISRSIRNTFEDAAITSAQVQIVKLNDDYTLPARVTVSSFTDTTSGVDITGDNTIVFNWNTATIATLPAVAAGTFGPLTGTYSIQVKYNILRETIVSDLMYLILD